MELSTYLNVLLPMLLFFIVLTIASKLIFSYGKFKVSHEHEKEEPEIDESTTLNLNNFTCADCKRTFTDPRPLSEIPIKPVGSITVCHVCHRGELRNEELSKIFPNRRPITAVNVQTGKGTMWQRKAEIERVKLNTNSHKKDIKKLRKLITEMERDKARGYTL